MNSMPETIRFFFLILAELTILFIGIDTLISLLREYVSDDRIRKLMGRKGFSGYFLGAALGAVTPFCSCSTIPVTAGLLKAKAPFGGVMAFLLASPVLNPIILGMFLFLLGWKACLAYGLVAFLASMLAGFVFQHSGLEKDIKPLGMAGTGCCCGGQDDFVMPRLLFSQKFAWSLRSAWGDFRGILWYMVGGVAIGAAVYGYVPASFIASVAGPGNPLAIPIAALVGVPLYVRAETMIPIAVALSGKGMGMGAVIALIIGGAGMSIPEMGMLASLFRLRLVAAFVAFVFLTAVAAGLVFSIIS
jgi:uncharacterized membrane protein YraQ (UPF0718 family)